MLARETVLRALMPRKPQGYFGEKGTALVCITAAAGYTSAHSTEAKMTRPPQSVSDFSLLSRPLLNHRLTPGIQLPDAFLPQEVGITRLTDRLTRFRDLRRRARPSPSPPDVDLDGSSTSHSHPQNLSSFWLRGHYADGNHPQS